MPGLAGIETLGVRSATIGYDFGDKLNVNASAFFISPVTVQNTFRVGGANNYLTINSNGDLTTTGGISVSGDLTVYGAQNFVGPTAISYSGTSTALTVTQGGSGDLVSFVDGFNGITRFNINSAGLITLTGGVIIEGSATTTGSMYATTYYSTSTDSTVRKSGEEVLRGSVSIYRFDMPAQQTNTTTYYRISKYFTDNPLSTTTLPKLPGADRIFRLAISYADTLPTDSSSTWRIYQTSPSATTCTFYLAGQNCTSTNPNCLSLEEGKPYLTEERFISGTSCYIPDSNWQVELKLPDQTKKIRIFNIFLLAYDRIQ